MQLDKILELRKEWKAKGNPPCTHPHYEEEHFLSSGTGNYACTVCGAFVDPEKLKN